MKINKNTCPQCGAPLQNTWRNQTKCHYCGSELTLSRFSEDIDSSDSDLDGKDLLYNDARSIVIEFQSGSIPLLQNKLRIDYTRAAQLIIMLEEDGVVGPFKGSKPRDVLITT